MEVQSQLKNITTSLVLRCAIGVLVFALAPFVHAEESKSEAVKPKENRIVLPAHYRSQLKASDFMIVEFTVTEQGEVEAPAVLATTRPDLKKEILSGVESWRFQEAEGALRIRQRIMLK